MRPPKVARRQIWWCRIDNEPMFPVVVDDEYRCPHCGGRLGDMGSAHEWMGVCGPDGVWSADKT